MPDQEEHGNARYHSEALLRAANVVGQETSKNVNRKTKDQENPEGALMYTYVQVMDSYREGTIDGQIEDSRNGANEIPRTDYEQQP